jgi:ribosomal protein S18 acetylase RimI-like enzyme
MSVSVDSLARVDAGWALGALLAAHDDFWDGRDTRFLLHPQWFRQFGRYGLLARDGTTPVGYLLGVVTTGAIGYVHAVAVRSGYRRFGLGRQMWDLFGALAVADGATELQAITTPDNQSSILFHTGLGMSAQEIPDYAGPGQARVLFRLAR